MRILEKAGIKPSDSTEVAVQKIKKFVDEKLPGESIPYRADQALLVLNVFVAETKKNYEKVNNTFVEVYGEGAAEALARQHEGWD